MAQFLIVRKEDRLKFNNFLLEQNETETRFGSRLGRNAKKEKKKKEEEKIKN